MKRAYLKYLLPIAAVLLVLAVALFFINPVAPLFLLLAVAVQVPIVYGMTASVQNNAYEARNDLRQKQFDEEGDAAAWLAQEDAEAQSIQRMFWSKGTKRLNALSRAEMMHVLGREEEAKATLAGAGVSPTAATDYEKKRFSVLRQVDTADTASAAVE